MKILLLFSGCLLLASTGLAAPKITEIRLVDAPGFVLTPYTKNEFVFRADGNLYWIEGTSEQPIRHRYSIGQEAFRQLAATVENHRFFDLKLSYPTDTFIADAPEVIVIATRGGTKKEVRDITGFGSRPANLWELEMIVRGIASRYTGLKRTPLPVPVARTKPTPTPTLIPVFRGTKQVPN